MIIPSWSKKIFVLKNKNEIYTVQVMRKKKNLDKKNEVICTTEVNTIVQQK